MALRPSRRSSSRTRSSSLRTSDAATTSSSKGDSDPNYTYISVGRVLSQWEGVKIELGYVYTAVAGNHGDWYKLLEYVEGSSFKGRFCILEKALSSFFVKHPEQEIEAKLECFLKKVNKFAARRHDVAHGIVRDHSWAGWRIPPDTTDPTGYFLLPSHYKGKALQRLRTQIFRLRH
jgi:hypothetical protein